MSGTVLMQQLHMGCGEPLSRLLFVAKTPIDRRAAQLAWQVPELSLIHALGRNDACLSRSLKR